MYFSIYCLITTFFEKYIVDIMESTRPYYPAQMAIILTNDIEARRLRYMKELNERSVN